MDLKQDKNPDDSCKKIFADLSEVPLLPGHTTYMVRSDGEIEAQWEELVSNQSKMNSAQKDLAERIVAFLETEGLIAEMSGVAATNFNCVWLNCSLRAWHRLELGMNLTAWSNPDITLES
jgi:hypothetical protein